MEHKFYISCSTSKILDRVLFHMHFMGAQLGHGGVCMVGALDGRYLLSEFTVIPGMFLLLTFPGQVVIIFATLHEGNKQVNTVVPKVERDFSFCHLLLSDLHLCKRSKTCRTKQAEYYKYNRNHSRPLLKGVAITLVCLWGHCVQNNAHRNSSK